MQTVTYYKLGHRWYLDLPEFVQEGGDVEDLERIGAFHDFLEMASEGNDEVVFRMDAEPFDGADFFEMTGSAGKDSGGYYHVPSFEGKPVDFELWFNAIVYRQYETPPQRIYFKRVFPVPSQSSTKF